ncbi:hypothetical protein BCR35DRAFT_299328 [Leucosporidium creatinivorum]|uniref:Zn(2)-C6 fungal-type domain-containing protein n=1 Tax=Leucosporidium creatinivorum TaxID=106004 RepID=A0A1Y2G5I5_9BASI|nr:hypothetical protein BCR35DRAFT_299328 [Leucosporidium creatinivorum]
MTEPAASTSAAQPVASTSTAPATSTPSKEAKKQACLACRAIKVRCLLPAEALPGSRCTRCIRLDFECVYGSLAPRGRKPKDRSLAVNQTTSQPFMPAPSPPMLLVGTGGLVNPADPHNWTNSLPPSLRTIPAPNSDTHHPPLRNAVAFAAAASPASIGTQPSPSTGSATAPESNTLFDNSVLSLVEAAEARSAASQAAPPPVPRAIVQHTYSDPVDLHVLGLLEAQQLFKDFHAFLNPFIILFDRHLHTAEWVRSTSTVLFSAILAVSAKFFRPTLYPTLLAHAQQLVTRGIADALSQIGLVQALCLLVYWKEPEDNSAWMKIGLAIRLGYQLRLHTRRQTPLPPVEFDARMILDRERTWYCLICFDFAYHLHDDEATQYTPSMTSANGLHLDKWLGEDLLYDCPDDVQLAASIEICNINAVTPAIQSSASEAATRALVNHQTNSLSCVYRKYLEPTAPSHRLAESRSVYKLKFLYLSSLVSVAKAHLVATGMQDDLVLADYLVRAANMTSCAVELADNNLLTYLQDTTAVVLFKFAEFLAQLFPLVSEVNQRSIVEWMTAIYCACNRAKDNQENGVPAILARFFRLAIRAVSIGNSIPPTRPSSPGPEAAVSAMDSGTAVPAPAPENPFNGLGGALEQELFPDLPDLSGGLIDTLDTSYWESVFPGYTTDNWAWLDPQNTLLPNHSDVGLEMGEQQASLMSGQASGAGASVLGA